MKRYFSFFIIATMLFSAAITSCDKDKDKDKAVTVTFAGNGGSDVAAKSVKRGDKVAKPGDPTKPHSGFDGWYNSSLTKAWNFELNTVSDNITLYAKWNLNIYTVTFNSNAGSTVSSQSIGGEKQAAEPATPAKAGYKFIGWYSDNNTFVNKWDFKVNTVTGDITLYAKWERITYTVTFAGNGGSDVAAQTIAEGEKTTAPATPVKAGYDFVGWYTDNNTFVNKWDFAVNTVTKDVTLYAKWELIVIKYTVTFNSNGGNTVTVQTIVEGEKATEPAAPAKSGVYFVGWYTDNNTFANKWDFAVNTVTENITLYAKWFTPINLLRGSDMEAGDAAHWLSYSYGSGVFTPLDVTFGYTDDKPNGGTGASVAFSGGAGSTRTYVYQAVQVEAGKKYLYTGQLKIPAGISCIYIRLAISASINTAGQMTPVVFEASTEGTLKTSSQYDGDLQGSIFTGSLNGSTGSKGVWTATTTGTVYIGFSVYACATPQAAVLYDDLKFEQISE